MTTHAELVAAVEEYQGKLPNGGPGHIEAQLDLCAAILNLHDESFIDYANMPPPCGHDHRDWFCTHDHRDWPCPTVGVVVDALRKTGVL